MKDDNVICLHRAHALRVLALEDDAEDGNLLVQSFPCVGARARSPVFQQLLVAVLPDNSHVRERVARKREQVFVALGPLIIEISAEGNRNDIDSLANRGDYGRRVSVCWVKLLLGPICRVEEGGTDSCLEAEESPIFGRCHAKIVLVDTWDVEVIDDPAKAI